MSTKDRTFTKEQASLAAELAATYDIDPDDIVFYGPAVPPTFGFEAGCILTNRLAEPQSLSFHPVASVLGDAASFNCRLVTRDGLVREMVGTAFVGECDRDGEQLSPSQLEMLAQNRALRGTLRVAGIDLLRLHHLRSAKPLAAADPKPRDPRVTLLAEVHALAEELGLIEGSDESGYRGILKARYGETTASKLTNAELGDLAAFFRLVRSQASQKRAA